MAKAQNSLPLSAIQQIDAVCDRFEADWKAGKKPAIEKFLGKATGAERAELLRALLRLELELQVGSDRKSQSSYEACFPEDASIVGSVFKELQDQGTLPPQSPSADTSVSQESQRSNLAATVRKVAKEIPKKIGRFQILEMVGQGGCGMVFKARDPDLDRLVAIKMPLQGALETQEEIQRFLREARAAATLHHPNLCPVHDVGMDEGNYYIVMAFVEGKSLSALLKERTEPLPAKQAALIIRKLALALAAAHGKGIIHRDLKPANIMIDGERKDVVIMDFGLARQRKNGEALQTKEGVVMGTPTYMAPEQARGDVKAIGPTSDVYSLGVILYEMLAGKPPFTGSVMEVICQVMADEPKPPSSRREGVEPRLEAICLKAMAKNPAQRYPNMKALADDLDKFLKALSEKPAPAAKTLAKGKETAGLSDLAKVLSAERKHETKAAIDEAVRRARIPLWKWLAGAAVLAVLIVGGIIFFARTPSATVIINVNVDLNDKTLVFLLDGKGISAENLKKPIELTVGKHELIAKRGETTVHRFTFTVSRDAGPRIEVTDDQIPQPKKTEPDAYPEKLLMNLNLPGVEDEFPFLTPDGLSIYFTREGPKHGPAAIYHARRQAVKEPFGQPIRVFDGRHVAVTADECYAVVLGQGVPAPLFEVNRPSREAPWAKPTRLTSFDINWSMKSPWLSPDGLTLVFQRKRTVAKYPGTLSELVITRRAKRQDPWGPVELLPLAHDPSLSQSVTWPRLSDDLKTLWFGHGGARDKTVLMTATRPDVKSPFANYRAVEVNGKAIQGQAPFYVAANKELFFSRDDTGTKSDNDLHMLQHEFAENPPKGDGWIALFNGTDFTGWHVESGDPKQWAVEDGAIVARSPNLNNRNYLLSNKDYADFTLRCEFMRDEKSGGGVVVRGLEGEKIVGELVDHPILKLTSVPGSSHFLKDDKQATRPSEELNLPTGVWHTLEMTVRGDRLTAILAGKKIVDMRLDPDYKSAFVPGLKRSKGKIGFQAHTGTMRYRRIEIKDLSPLVQDDFGPLVFDHSLTKAKTLDEFHVSWGWDAKAAVIPGTGLKLSIGNTPPIVWAKPYLGDRYRVQFEVQFEQRGGARWILNGPGYGNYLNTGYRCEIDQTMFWLSRPETAGKSAKLPRPIAPGEWATVQTDFDRGKIAITINGQRVCDFSDAEPLTGPLYGWFGLTNGLHQHGNGIYRNLRIWSVAKDTNRERLLTPPVTDKAHANGKLLYELKPADGKLGPEWWQAQPVNASTGAVVLSGTDIILTKPLTPDLACEVELEYPTPNAYGLSVKLWFAKKAPKSTKECDAGWLVDMPMTDGRSTISWHNGPKHVHQFGGFFSAAPILVSAPNYSPIAGRKYVARIETFGSQLRFFLDSGLVMTAKRPADATAPATPVFFSLNQQFSTTKIHAVRVYEMKKLPADSPTAAERQAIAAVFKLGGRVSVIKGGQGHDAGRPEELPPEPYHLFAVDWIQRPVEDADLAVLAGLPRLGDIWLGGSKVTDAGLAHLANAAKLGGLRLEGTVVTGAGFRSLDKSENLGCLYLQGSKVNDAGVKALGQRPKLLELYLSGTPITDEALKYVASNFPGLAQLGLQKTKITNAGLAHLKGHGGLVNLFLEDTAVTNEGLAHLSSLKIQRLELAGTGITDAGLVHLEKMRSLEFVTLGRTKVTPAGIDRLQKALPKIQIVR